MFKQFQYVFQLNFVTVNMELRNKLDCEESMFVYWGYVQRTKNCEKSQTL